jgi:UDP-N-acetylglucosamine pyrophosphorylase
VQSFKHSYDAFVSGDTGAIPEASIDPVGDGEMASLASVRSAAGFKPDSALLDKLVILKLNGGLGTSMGLERAKSLLHVRGGTTFLDLIAQQVLALRRLHHRHLRFTLMNSFSTSEDTRDLLGRSYPTLAADAAIEIVQNKAPKIDTATLRPATWSANPKLEWCPPGHGDLYATLRGSGVLRQLVEDGYRYMFVSNSDNLGANLDLDILTHFAQSQKPFMMELCSRRENDKKGGHLARRKSDGRLILREVAQCPAEDEDQFQDITKHRFFNTNNLWLRLDKLLEAMDAAEGGALPLPLIVARKTVDPKDDGSTPVVHLETAMGAAIQCFDDAGGIVVGRGRFAPVKKTSDLFALRSDAYEVSDAFTMVATTEGGEPPVVDLDRKHFKLVSQLESAVTGEVPSMIKCKRLTVKGPVLFAPRGVVFEGTVEIVNRGKEPKTVLPGTYTDLAGEHKLDLTDEPGGP